MGLGRMGSGWKWREWKGHGGARDGGGGREGWGSGEVEEGG